MCGIAGYHGKTIAPDAAVERLGTMVAALRHRGPDGEGVLVRGDTGLAHTRLSIVGLADGAQPMTSENGEVAVTFNGEIFNYVELRDDLKARGHRFRTGSDTEVLLAAYLEKGIDCLSDLNGDFAFALHDARSQTLVIARDRMGVRPLFYTDRLAPIALYDIEKRVPLLRGRGPRVIRIADALGIGAEHHYAARAFRIRRREQGTHRATFRNAD